MDIDRRGFILATFVAAVAPLAAGAAGAWTRAAAAAAPMLRPARIASGPVCARCGQSGHTALDPMCPVNSETWTTLQSAARRGAGSFRGTGT